MSEALRWVGLEGFVLVLVSAPSARAMATLHGVERALLADVCLGSALRVFLGWKGDPRVGWAVVLCNHPDADHAMAASQLLRGVYESVAATTTGAVLNLENIAQEENVKDAKRQALFPAQRGQAFYIRLFRDLGIWRGPRGATVGQPEGPEWRFCIVEADAGVGDVLELVVESLQAGDIQPAIGNDGAPAAFWIGAVTLGGAESPSNAARHRRIQDLIQQASAFAVGRARELRRQGSVLLSEHVAGSR